MPNAKTKTHPSLVAVAEGRWYGGCGFLFLRPSPPPTVGFKRAAINRATVVVDDVGSDAFLVAARSPTKLTVTGCSVHTRSTPTQSAGLTGRNRAAGRPAGRSALEVDFVVSNNRPRRYSIRRNRRNLPVCITDARSLPFARIIDAGRRGDRSAAADCSFIELERHAVDHRGSPRWVR